MRKKSLLKLFGTTLAVCAVSGALVGVNAALTADAAEAPAKTVFAMEDKASVRLGSGAEDAGIRFRVVMDETMKKYIVDNEEVTYGFLIFQQKDLAAVEGNYRDIAKKVEIAGDEAKIYLDEEKGNYYANGVLANIQAGNFDRAYTCVAYTYDSTTDTYTYAKLNAEFSRTVHEVASKAYIYESDKRDRLAATYALGETNPVLIGSYDDLSAVSAEVAAGTAFSGVNFKLGANITLAEDYTAISQSFGGTIDFGNSVVFAAQDQKITEKRYSALNEHYVEVRDGNPYLITLRQADAYQKYKKIGTAGDVVFVDSTQLATKTPWAQGHGEYSGNAVSVQYNGAADYAQTLVLDWTGEQLQALKQLGYKSITFNFLVYNGNDVYNNTLSSTNATITNFMYLGQKYHVLDGKLIAPGALHWNTWYNLSLSIDEVAGKLEDETLTLIKEIGKTGLTPTFYFGEVTLSTELPLELTTIWSAESDYAKLKNVRVVNKDENGLISSIASDLVGQPGESSNEAYIAYQANCANQIFVQLDYTVEQLQFLKTKGYTGISTTLRVTANADNYAGSLTFNSEGMFGTYYFIGVGKTEEGKTAYNSPAIPITATIDQLIYYMEQVDNSKNAVKNLLWLGTCEDRNGSSILQIRFTDFVLTKE